MQINVNVNQGLPQTNTDNKSQQDQQFNNQELNDLSENFNELLSVLDQKADGDGQGESKDKGSDKDKCGNDKTKGADKSSNDKPGLDDGSSFGDGNGTAGEDMTKMLEMLMQLLEMMMGEEDGEQSQGNGGQTGDNNQPVTININKAA
ncbi:MAG: hypothetical protein WED00_13540 [Aquisalimonadaceae bacterium]